MRGAEDFPLSSKSIGLYIHLPYCLKKCPYCDFNSYAVDLSELADREMPYLEALVGEFELYRAEWEGRECQSIYLVGALHRSLRLRQSGACLKGCAKP